MRRREFITLLGGATVAWPLVARAQVSTRRPLVAVLTGASSATASRYVGGFAERMQELGYVASRDVDIVYRYADGDLARLPGLVDELVRLKPDVLIAVNTEAAIAMRQATATIRSLPRQSLIRLPLAWSQAMPGPEQTSPESWPPWTPCPRSSWHLPPRSFAAPSKWG